MIVIKIGSKISEDQQNNTDQDNTDQMALSRISKDEKELTVGFSTLIKNGYIPILKAQGIGGQIPRHDAKIGQGVQGKVYEVTKRW